MSRKIDLATDTASPVRSARRSIGLITKIPDERADFTGGGGLVRLAEGLVALPSCKVDQKGELLEGRRLDIRRDLASSQISANCRQRIIEGSYLLSKSVPFAANLIALFTCMIALDTEDGRVIREVSSCWSGRDRRARLCGARKPESRQFSFGFPLALPQFCLTLLRSLGAIPLSSRFPESLCGAQLLCGPLPLSLRPICLCLPARLLGSLPRQCDCLAVSLSAARNMPGALREALFGFAPDNTWPIHLLVASAPETHGRAGVPIDGVREHLALGSDRHLADQKAGVSIHHATRIHRPCGNNNMKVRLFLPVLASGVNGCQRRVTARAPVLNDRVGRCSAGLRRTVDWQPSGRAEA